MLHSKTGIDAFNRWKLSNHHKVQMSSTRLTRTHITRTYIMCAMYSAQSLKRSIFAPNNNNHNRS